MEHIGYAFLTRQLKENTIEPKSLQYCTQIIQHLSKQELWNIYCDFEYNILYHNLGAVLYYTILKYKEPFGDTFQNKIKAILSHMIIEGVKKI
jgi:hypothetical protein